jgi:hypothetical protein
MNRNQPIGVTTLSHRALHRSGRHGWLAEGACSRCGRVVVYSTRTGNLRPHKCVGAESVPL